MVPPHPLWLNGLQALVSSSKYHLCEGCLALHLTPGSGFTRHLSGSTAICSSGSMSSGTGVGANVRNKSRQTHSESSSVGIEAKRAGEEGGTAVYTGFMMDAGGGQTSNAEVELIDVSGFYQQRNEMFGNAVDKDRPEWSCARRIKKWMNGRDESRVSARTEGQKNTLIACVCVCGNRR